MVVAYIKMHHESQERDCPSRGAVLHIYEALLFHSPQRKPANRFSTLVETTNELAGAARLLARLLLTIRGRDDSWRKLYIWDRSVDDP